MARNISASRSRQEGSRSSATRSRSSRSSPSPLSTKNSLMISSIPSMAMDMGSPADSRPILEHWRCKLHRHEVQEDYQRGLGRINEQRARGRETVTQPGVGG